MIFFCFAAFISFTVTSCVTCNAALVGNTRRYAGVLLELAYTQKTVSLLFFLALIIKLTLWSGVREEVRFLFRSLRFVALHSGLKTLHSGSSDSFTPLTQTNLLSEPRPNSQRSITREPLRPFLNCKLHPI